MNKKHIFITAHDCIFIENLLTNLINEQVIKKEDILVILYQGYGRRSLIKEKLKNFGLLAINWQTNLNLKYKSINSISLHSKNASIILELSKKNYSNTNIIITDDELYRWEKIFKSNKKLTTNNSLLTNKDVIDVINYNPVYICPKSAENDIKKVTNKKIKLIDASLPFSLFSNHKIKLLEQFFNKNKKERKEFKRILFFTKPQKINYSLFSLNLLKYFFLKKSKNKKNYKSFTLGIWLRFNSFEFILLQLSIFIIRVFKKIDIRFELLSQMPIERYYAEIQSFDALILQPRGGFSTAKYFAENIGQVIVENSTPNHKAFKYDYEIDIDTFKDIYSCFDNALDYNKESNLDENKLKIISRHKQSILKLKKLWNSY